MSPMGGSLLLIVDDSTIIALLDAGGRGRPPHQIMRTIPLDCIPARDTQATV